MVALSNCISSHAVSATDSSSYKNSRISGLCYGNYKVGIDLMVKNVGSLAASVSTCVESCIE